MCSGYKFNFSFKITERENIVHLMKIYTKIKEQREKKKEKWKKYYKERDVNTRMVMNNSN